MKKYAFELRGNYNINTTLQQLKKNQKKQLDWLPFKFLAIFFQKLNI